MAATLHLFTDQTVDLPPVLRRRTLDGTLRLDVRLRMHDETFTLTGRRDEVLSLLNRLAETARGATEGQL